MTEPSTRWRAPDFSRLAIRWPGWMRNGWASFRAAPGRMLWPVAVGVGLITAAYFGLMALSDGGESYSGQDGGWLEDLLRVGSSIVLVAAMAAALTWLLRWLSAQGLAPRLWTALKLVLALTPLSVGVLADFDGLYQPMDEPLKSYLMLIAVPFVVAGLLAALDRRRAPGLAVIATLAPVALFLAAGAVAENLLEPVEHLREALLAREPDQRMWWLALAALPIAIFALVAAVGDRPDEQE